jgi:transposase
VIFNEVKQQRALELHSQGLAARLIASRLGVSYPTIRNWLLKNNLYPIAVCDSNTF